MQASALLVDLLLELRTLRAAVEGLAEEQRHLARRLLVADDRRELARLLPLVHGMMADRAWSAAGLYEAAALGDESSAELATALQQWNTTSGGLRAFGGLLERCAGCVSGGLRLVALGTKDRTGALYQVARLSRVPKVAGSLAPGAAAADHGTQTSRSTQ